MQCRDTLAYSNDYPTITQIDDDEYKKRVYYSTSSSFAVKPNGEQFCNFTRNGMLMEIYDMQNNKMRSIALRRFHRPKMGDNMRDGTNECVRGGWCIYVTNNYIYVAYHDQTRETDSKYLKTSIAVFDWNGKEVA